MFFMEETARAWMREQVELARDLRTGGVLAEELAERCALHFGVAEAGGPLEDPAHWLHALAREVAAAAEPLGALALVRIRSHGRTYWMVADCARRMTFAPHVARRDAILRFETATGRRHSEVRIFRAHHAPPEAAALLASLWPRATS